jgi:hypothetical protein
LNSFFEKAAVVYILFRGCLYQHCIDRIIVFAVDSIEQHEQQQ